MVGKRKRDTSVVSRSTARNEQDTLSTPTTPTDVSHDLFRKFFESQFEPLDLPKVSRETELDKNEEEDESEEADSGSDWNGIEGEEGEDGKVEVVEHQDSSKESDRLLDKKARKAFMNAKPPSFDIDMASAKPKLTKDDGDGDDKATDAEHLKDDLALQRLLKESHLLESASELAPTGKNRHRALDMRMQSLGANSSLYQQKMPSSHRRGIKAKVLGKDEKRRREAKENGIILEKPNPKSKTSSNRKRDRGPGGSSVGKFTGGTLNLSQRDINAVTGSARKNRRR